jgi:hypothetical protein
MISECKLCGKVTKLCRSHIIPEFLYRNIYDKSPKKFWVLVSSIAGKKRAQMQKGIREYLLCEKCENKISVYERYAERILYAQNRNSPVKLIRSSSSNNMTFHEFEGFDYRTFRLFLLSLLWRILISKENYDTDYIDNSVQAYLKSAIQGEDPLNENDFCCFIQMMVHRDGSPFGHTILGPFQTSYHEKDVLNILIDSFLFSFIIGQIELPTEINSHILNNQGKMTIIKRCVNDDPNIMEAVKRMAEDFGDLYGAGL